MRKNVDGQPGVPMFGKLFASLYQGTLRGQAHEILVFTNMIACSDREGCIDKHPRAIAEEVGLTVEQVRAAIAKLEAPDPESRSQEEEGRRIVLLDDHRAWGWRIVNHAKYRGIRDEEARRETFRNSQRRSRARQQASTHVNTGHDPSSVSTHTEAEDRGRGQRQKHSHARAREADTSEPAPTERPSPDSADAGEGLRSLPDMTPVQHGGDPIAATVAAMREAAGETGKAWTRRHVDAAKAAVRSLLGEGKPVPLVLSAWGRYCADGYWRDKGLPMPKFLEHFPRFAAEPVAPRPSEDQRRRGMGKAAWQPGSCGRCQHAETRHDFTAAEGEPCRDCDCPAFATPTGIAS